MKPGIYFVRRHGALPSLTGVFIVEHRHCRRHQISISTGTIQGRLNVEYEDWLDFGYALPSSHPDGDVIAGPYTPEDLLALARALECGVEQIIAAATGTPADTEAQPSPPQSRPPAKRRSR